MSLAGLENIFLEVLSASRDAAILALAIGALLLFAGRKITPHWRHLLWMLVALRLMLPVLPESPSSWQRWMPEETNVPQKLIPVVEHTLPSDLPKMVPHQSAEGVNFQPPEIVTEVKALPLSWPSVLALVWITGVVSFLILLCICTLRFRRKLRRLSFPDHEKIAPLRELLEQLCRETGIRRLPALRITEAVASPALTGLLRPEILIPPSAIEQLKMSELRLVLLHELGHQQRRDLWTSWLLSLLHVIHWFNPLVWWAFYRTRHESERATDAWVLQKTGADRAADYGEALLRLLEGSAKTKMPLPNVVGVLESPRDLRARITAIGRFTGKRSRWALALSVLLICGLVAVGFTQAPKDKVEKQIPISCGGGFSVPSFHFDSVGNDGALYYAETWFSFGSRSDTIPFVVSFDSVRGETSPYLGKGWRFNFLESRAYKEDEKRVGVVMPDGYKFTFIQTRGDLYEGNQGWIGKVDGNTFTIAAASGNQTMVFENGWIAEVTRGESSYRIVRNSDNKALKVVDLSNNRSAASFDYSRGGMLTGIDIGHDYIEIGQVIPSKDYASDRLLTDPPVPALSRAKFRKIDFEKTYELSFGKETSTLEVQANGSLERKFVWDLDTGYVISDGDWKYTVDKMESGLRISRRNSDLSESYHMDSKRNIETIGMPDGSLVRFTYLNSGANRNNLLEKEIFDDGVWRSALVNSFDDNGRLLRQIDNEKNLLVTETENEAGEWEKVVKGKLNNKLLRKSTVTKEGDPLTHYDFEANTITTYKYDPDGKILSREVARLK